MCMAVFGLGMVAWFFFRCVGRNFEGCDGIMPGPLAFVFTLLGVFEGFLFSLFTCIMFCTQVHAIATDETVRGCGQGVCVYNVVNRCSYLLITCCVPEEVC